MSATSRETIERVVAAWEDFASKMRSFRQRRLKTLEAFIGRRNKDKIRVLRDSLRNYDRKE